jgi:hypothetical protein
MRTIVISNSGMHYSHKEQHAIKCSLINSMSEFFTLSHAEISNCPPHAMTGLATRAGILQIRHHKHSTYSYFDCWVIKI